MIRAVVLFGLALPIVACGSKPTVDEKNATVAEVSEKVREASGSEGLIRPGKWQSKVTIEQMTMPGMPPEAAEQMKTMMTQAQTSETCVTPEEVRKPRPEMFGGNDQCRYDHFTMGGGKIDAQMHCSHEGATQVMEMAGTYSPDSYKMRMKSRTEAGDSEGMSMEMSVDARRVGDCSGKET